MTRNLGTLLFIIIYIFGYFHNVPYILLIALMFVTILENISLYMMLYNNSQTKFAKWLRNLGTIYMSYDIPNYTSRPILFTFDRLIYSFVMAYLMYVLFTYYPQPKIF
jgi:hypothetical protein